MKTETNCLRRKGMAGKLAAVLVLLVALILALILGVAARPSSAQELTDVAVRNAIARGVALIKKNHDSVGGGWPEHPNQPGGLTALCALALLNSGVEKKDPVIQGALGYLRKLGNPKATYSTALITMLYCAAEPERDRLAISQYVEWLESAQIKEGKFSGAWGYGAGKPPGDNSNSQFALMALYEAQLVGVKVNEATWRRALEYWKQVQKPDGSWGYQGNDTEIRGSMACAGISALVMSMGSLGGSDAQVQNGQVLCCGATDDDDHLKRGLKWLGDKFTVNSNPGAEGGSAWQYYYLYGVERVGRLTGKRFIGQHDWFREGAEFFVRQQDALVGGWRGDRPIESNPLITTSFALLFLSKGRRPVVMAKVKLGSEPTWDAHRTAVRNLTWRVEKRWKKDLSWQTIDDLSRASVADLLESPILFLSGKEAISLPVEVQERLREYVQQGGFIFAEACCDGTDFDRSFRQLMKDLFPESPLRLLPPEHAIWYAEQPVGGDYLRPLYGVDACCRTSIVYCPQNLSCYWELYRDGRDLNYPKTVQDEIETCLRIGQNVITYATNRELKEKLDRPKMATRDPASNEVQRGVFYVAKLAYSGGGDDAPNALSNLLGMLREQLRIRVATDKRLLAATDPSLYEYPVLFLHGRRSFRLSTAERKALTTFVERGGVIFADAICGNDEFSDSFRREIRAAFPDRPLERIPASHPLFTTQYRGYDLRRVSIRNPLTRGDNEGLQAKETQSEPFLEGIAIDDRLAVIFSPYDLSCALENAASLECKGYSRSDAAKIGMNVLLYALQQ